MATNPASIELNLIQRVQSQLLGGGADGQTYPLFQETDRGDSPVLVPPAGAAAFDETGGVALPAVGGTATVLSMTVPQGYDGTIQAYTISFLGGGFVDNSGDIQWQIQADGRPIRNFNNILSIRGSQVSPRLIAGGGIRIYSGQVIRIVVNHLANVLLNGGTEGSLLGFFFPRKG